MVLKRKKNCKLIFEPKNGKYYVDETMHLSEYQDLQEAFRKYEEIHKVEKWNEERFYKDGYLKYDLLPEQVFLIAKSIEIFKFFVDNSFFFKCDNEFLKSKSIDLFYLYQIMYKQYVHYIPKNVQSQIEKKNDFRNFGKSRIGEGIRDINPFKKIYNIAQNETFVQKRSRAKYKDTWFWYPL